MATGREGRKPRLELALSAKWSLRTARAPDCVSQGAQRVAQRRGRMPHFAVITREPRPAMLRILADGSGAVDCVYH
ncbi:NgoMIV family type II restriction endonuclease, partial [Campylobacter coli]|uniref:NgoMIV family type II restriction endonuclease n=1 Tax=Campylobacter coli TaxID=195 RepID=UPI00338E74E9